MLLVKRPLPGVPWRAMVETSFWSFDGFAGDRVVVCAAGEASGAWVPLSLALARGL